MEIVRKALERPARRIAENAGWDGSVVVARIAEGQGAFGFNAQTEVFADLERAGVIDPTKVERTALQNAASVASLLLTTESAVTERPKRKSGRGGSRGGGGGMGGMGDMGGMGGMGDMGDMDF